MTILTLDRKPVTDFSDPLRKVRLDRLDVYGDVIYGGLRTLAHFEQTSARAKAKFGHEIEVLQGCFNTDVEASAGTHDYDVMLDCFIPGVDWWDQQRFIRWQGWFGWYRYPPKFGRHLHMGSLGYGRARVGIYVPGQLRDYLAHPPKDGLAGETLDLTPRPDNLAAVTFDFAQWRREMEEEMGWSDWTRAEQNDMLDRLADRVTNRLLNEPINRKGEEPMDVEQALRRASRGPEVTRKETDEIDETLEGGN